MASDQEELIIYRRAMRIPYRWAAGLTATRFYREIADSKKIFGTRCPKCARVLVPARKNCSRCFQDTEEWVEVGPAGVVTSFTVVHYEIAEIGAPPPYLFALIKLDGADTAFMHRLGGVEAGSVKTGMRVTAVFKEQPGGTILDIDHFKPLS